MRQCFKCQKYGHIGTQCKAPTVCGYCAQGHDTRDCPSKSDRSVPRRCTTCRGEHVAWNHQCPTRREEIAKAKSAYEMRPRYHHVAEAVGQAVQLETTATIRRSRPSQTAAPVQTVQITRNRSQTGRGQKRTNTGTTVDLTDQENLPT